ncbi:transcription antitermination factor NusB [Jiulongibacter sp. NS-SX5]|uniref:transcription antitermination factor NusB n=1 Tax=Jiulongibacter sp. NS-SX5 TaxID=3463854 RepID=UPI0040584F1C
MLNRRLIRIRAMQALYAYEQSRKANLLLAEDLIKENFAPDLNSMEVQDKPKLKGLTDLSIKVLHEELSIHETTEDFEAPKAVTQAVKEAKILFNNRNKADFDQMSLRTLREADKVFVVYLKLLNLYLALADLSLADRKFEGKSRLADNKLLKALQENSEFEILSLKAEAQWNEEKDFVKSLYNTVLRENERYNEYCSKINHTLDEEIALLKYMVKNVFLKNEVSVNYFERFHLYFSEDRETLRAMVAHTFQNYDEEDGLEIAQSNEEWKERKEFLGKLFKQSIQRENELNEYILPKLKNWEYERVADADKILMRMALIEFMEFPSIPIKVTINEIIEIAKTYSTPKSGVFMNGVLDTLSKELVRSGEIRKSGRGMLDNK